MTDLHSRTEWMTTFSFAKDTEFLLHAPPEQLVSEIRQNIEHTPNEWRDALEWALADKDARLWSLVKFERGHSAWQWKKLIEAAIQIARSNPLFPEWCHSLQIEMKTDEDWFLSPVPLKVNRRPFSGLTFPIDLSLLLDIVEDHFNGTIHHDRWRGWHIGSGVLKRLPPIWIEAEQPNSHELMQALDLWRDFGRRSG